MEGLWRDYGGIMFRGLSEEGLLTNLWGDKFLIDIKK